ncbi:oligoendopeptidase F [Clostridium cylindrosporum]|uniref:Oligopeptidase F n=1 Tax=Clostridium cylindrosporum DSM 605 TaxID=1121307 RepID=A0A0J8DAT6_CLOCY|nr:oligoendopeptidase F [Clostridium cylindrosporum]KMT21413.1 oligoendopeptidase F [Clostridium cylindrosporum DSM 605]
MLEVKERSAIEDKYKWDIDTIYSSKEDILRDKEKIDLLVNEIISLKGKILDSGENLYKVLWLSDEAERITGKILSFTFMKRDEDNSNSDNQNLASLGEKINVDVDSKLSFIVPEILSQGDEKIYNLIGAYEKLSLYKRLLDELIRKKKIVLSESEEKILSASQEVSLSFENIYKMLSYVDLKYPKIKDSKGDEFELNDSNYSTFIRSDDRVLRENAFKGMLGTYEGFKSTYGAILSSSIKKDVFYSKTRGFKSSLEASLFEDNIPVDVYKNVISTVSKGIPLLDEYIGIKKKELGLSEMHLYDLYAPTVKSSNTKVDFEKAKEMIKTSLNILGNDYKSILDEAFNNKWIDVYYNKGKYTGAYSWGSYDTKPYILLNYKEKLDDVLTLAHELGHSIHSYYSRKTQPYVYSSYTIFCAEVASITNECLMYLYLMETLKGEERRYVIDEFLESIRTTFFRQGMFAEFEMLSHGEADKDEALNGEELSKIWIDLYKKYYGNVCVIDKDISSEWARIPHFFDSFYVYKYATGLSAGISMAKSILENEENLNKYIEFLKSGGSDYSIELLKKAGVDFTTTKPLDDTLEMFKYLLDEYKK